MAAQSRYKRVDRRHWLAGGVGIACLGAAMRERIIALAIAVVFWGSTIAPFVLIAAIIIASNAPGQSRPASGRTLDRVVGSLDSET